MCKINYKFLLMPLMKKYNEYKGRKVENYRKYNDKILKDRFLSVESWDNSEFIEFKFP